MLKNKLENYFEYVDVPYIKKYRFSFVKNDILKENISIKMQNIIFLSSLEEKYELPGAVRHSTFKTIIVFMASIVESLINYKLHDLIELGRVEEDKIVGKEEKYPECRELYKISDTEKICGVRKVVKPKKLSHDTDFIELNRVAKRSGLFTEKLFQNSEEMRTARNRIHTYGLTEVDDRYSKEEIDKFFVMAKEIIDRVESY